MPSKDTPRLCQTCRERPIAPYDRNYCPQCRTRKYAYSKGNRCPDCGVAVSNEATVCRTCASIRNNQHVDRVCAECGTDYRAKPSVRLVYCSQPCALIAQSRKLQRGGEGHPRYLGTEARVEGHGYATVYAGNGKRRKREHVAIAERVLGRPLRPGEVVHHINLDKSDNRHENLLICTNSYHQWLHQEMARAWAREHLGAKLRE